MQGKFYAGRLSDSLFSPRNVRAVQSLYLPKRGLGCWAVHLSPLFLNKQESGDRSFQHYPSAQNSRFMTTLYEPHPLLSRAQLLLDKKACFFPERTYEKPLDLNPEAEEVRVLLLGDTGSGNEDQHQVSRRSWQTCCELGADLVLLLGDNFIMDGVDSVEDEQWRTKFEEVYEHQLPFYAVLGNHDLRGNWRAQIAYSDLSERWVMPDVNYSFQAGPLEIFGINTTCTVCSLWTLQKPRVQPWRLVFGHRPLVTRGRHRGMTWLERMLVRWARPDVFCSGHNHLLEHTRWQGIDQITSGGGGNPIHSADYETIPEGEFLAETMGYVWLHASREELEARFFNDEGEELYRFRRQQS